MKKYLFCVLGLLFLTLFSLQAQEMSRQEKKAAKEKAKQERALNEQLMYQGAIDAIGSSAFILEADVIYLKRGQSYPVSSSVNFISVEGEKAVVQIASNAAIGGPNGLGGITVEGNVSNLTVDKDKKGIVRLRMNVSGVAVSAQVEIVLFGGGNRAEATVYPNFNSRRLTMNGRIVPLQSSNTYKSGFSF
ncbi:MAG: DUF4251 domain-containing protein [Bacteroidales bacterium]